MTQHMVGFLIIFGASLAGYAQLGPWIIAVASLGLLALSIAERQGMMRRAADIGFTALAERSFLGSLLNGVCATGGAYVFGLLLRAL
jgi:hypothetical protein